MLKKIIIGLCLALGIYSYYTTTKLQDTRKELERIENNLTYYQGLTSKEHEQNRVLQLTIDDLTYSNDSLIQKLEQIREELDIKSKDIKSEAYVKTVIKDSIRTVVEDKDFTALLTLNGLTNVTVSKQDSILDVKLDITNEQYLYVKRKKVYKRKYKNGWQRFWHFDWKKIEVNEYQIHNSNPIIKVKETRVIEL